MRFTSTLLASLALCLFTVTLVAAQTDDTAQTSSVSSWKELSSDQLDPESTFQVSELTLLTGAGEVILKTGVLSFQDSSDPGVAVFQGQGVLRWHPQDSIEMQQLVRVVGAPAISTSFRFSASSIILV